MTDTYHRPQTPTTALPGPSTGLDRVPATIDIPEDWTPWMTLREGHDARGHAVEIPLSLINQYLQAEAAWRQVQAILRQVLDNVPCKS